MEENKENLNNEENNLDNLSSMFDENQESMFSSSEIEVAKEDTYDILNPLDEIQNVEETKENIVQDINLDEENENPNNLITVRPVKFQEFPKENVNRAIKKNLDILQDISMRISVEIGRTNSSIREIMNFSEGSIVELDKIAGEQVEIYANNKLVARGEVIVIEDKFGVRVTTTNLPKPDELI